MFGEVRALTAALFERYGRYQARAVIAIAYWTVVAVTAVMVRALGRRLLPEAGRDSVGSYWTQRPPFAHTLRDLRRQF